MGPSETKRGEPGTAARGSRVRLALLRLGLVGIGLVLALLLLEGALQLASYGNRLALYFDPEIGFRYIPNQRRPVLDPETGVHLGTVTIHSGGYRVPELPPARPGRTRIACLGDSLAFGWSVEDDESYPAVLQSLLDERVELDVGVGNLAVPGYCAWNALQTWRHVVRPLEPDVVVLGWFSNDLEPPANGPRNTDGPLFKLLGRTAMAVAFHRHVRGHIPWFAPEVDEERREARRIYRRHELLVRYEPDDPIAAPLWERSLGDIATLAHEVRAAGAAFVLLVLPDPRQTASLRAARDLGPALREAEWERHSRAQARLARLARELDVPLVDPLEDLVRLDEEPFGLIDRAHPSPAGHRAIAERLAEELEHEDLLRPRELRARGLDGD